MNIDKAKFLFMYEVNAFKPLSDSQHEGLMELLTCIEADDKITDMQWVAYMLATTYHECQMTWQPIEEYGKGEGKKYGMADSVTGHVYYGRGYVQLTWADNYKAVGKAIGADLYHHPELALQPDIAYKIMSYGMRRGAFTGVGLAKYIHDGACDYVNARRVINGMDCAEKISGYAVKFENILKECPA